MDNFLIRTCKSGDLSKIMLLQQELAQEDIIYGLVPASEEDLDEKLGDYFLIAELNNEIVGFCYGSMHESDGLAVIPKGETYLEVDDVYVKAGSRDQGIGGKLLDALVAKAQVNNIKRFLVYSASKDTDKILDFYRRHGFESWSVQMFK